MVPEPEAAAVTSLDVRDRLVEALKLDLIGPWPGHALAEERLPGHYRPSNWYLAGFLIPSGTPAESSADLDEDEDFDEIPEDAGLPEESSEERRTAKKAYFPSSVGLSFLTSAQTSALDVTVRWGDDGIGESSCRGHWTRSGGTLGACERCPTWSFDLPTALPSWPRPAC